MFYNNKMIPHIGTRPVSPGFVAGSVAPVAPVVPIMQAPALVTSQVAVAQPVYASTVLPTIAATTATVIDTGCPVGKGLN
jgi:hypothetical protein